MSTDCDFCSDDAAAAESPIEVEVEVASDDSDSDGCVLKEVPFIFDFESSQVVPA